MPSRIIVSELIMNNLFVLEFAAMLQLMAILIIGHGKLNILECDHIVHI